MGKLKQTAKPSPKPAPKPERVVSIKLSESEARSLLLALTNAIRHTPEPIK